MLPFWLSDIFSSVTILCVCRRKIIWFQCNFQLIHYIYVLFLAEYRYAIFETCWAKNTLVNACSIQILFTKYKKWPKRNLSFETHCANTFCCSCKWRYPKCDFKWAYNMFQVWHIDMNCEIWNKYLYCCYGAYHCMTF